MPPSAGPSTPIRALPSTLASRAAPSVPPASQSYEPRVKEVLRHRLLSRIFLSSAVFVWGLVVVASTIRQGGVAKLGVTGVLLNPVLPRTVGLAACIWAFGVVPIVACRKAFLTATPTPASSPSKVFHTSLTKPSTLRSLLVYIASATLITTVHVLTTLIFETKASNDLRLSLFVKSRKHPLYLNGRLLYLLFSQICLAIFCVARNVILDRNAVKWTGAMAASKRGDVPTFMLAKVVTVAISAFIVTIMGTAAHIVLFGASRSFFLPIAFQLPFFSRLLRPFLAHFLRGSWSLTLVTKNSTLIFRAFWLGFMTVATWDFAESLVDSHVAEPVTVASSTADPVLTVVSGISSTDPYFQHFAYAELDQFANDESEVGVARRVAFFTDQRYNPTPWSTFVRQALLTLGNDYQLLLRRGAPPPAAPAPAEAPKTVEVPPQFPKAPYLHTQVLKPAQSSPLRSALETIASDGPITAALTSTAEASVSQIPELFRSVMPSQSAAVAEKAGAAVESVKKGEQEIKQLANLPAQWTSQFRGEVARRSPAAAGHVVARLREWWHRERVFRVVEAALPNRKMDGLAIDALCALICASLEEDRYGVVQRDVPRILEALLSFLTAIEDYQAELIAAHPLPSAEELKQMPAQEAAEKQALAFELSRAGDVLSEVEDPLKAGMVKIVHTFGDKLSAFKFPPRTARKLQGFVDYN